MSNVKKRRKRNNSLLRYELKVVLLNTKSTDSLSKMFVCLFCGQGDCNFTTQKYLQQWQKHVTM